MITYIGPASAPSTVIFTAVPEFNGWVLPAFGPVTAPLIVPSTGVYHISYTAQLSFLNSAIKASAVMKVKKLTSSTAQYISNSQCTIQQPTGHIAELGVTFIASLTQGDELTFDLISSSVDNAAYVPMNNIPLSTFGPNPSFSVSIYRMM